ncbi:hypothetical protein [Corynebacterium caspium]|uniref:hypothetical protein n=1 Tax=Corynebacterium caspium TaxID=234828 RepID=UPI00036DBD86|nr:hypothetical protein [Corynebacterium caspium]WKD58575.1 hypothetical protein CCASP_00735 [Corynebacterium caspium DSM 44850]
MKIASLILFALALMIGRNSPHSRIQTVLLSDASPRDGPSLKNFKSAKELCSQLTGPWLNKLIASLSTPLWKDGELPLAADIELYAAGISAGLSPTAAAGIIAEVLTASCRNTMPAGVNTGEKLVRQRRDLWQSLSALQALGVEPVRAWEPARGVPGVAQLATIEVLSHTAGSQVSNGAKNIAAGLRDTATDQVISAAERAGVLIAIPLSFCFLPAFFILGLVPVIVGLMAEIFS